MKTLLSLFIYSRLTLCFTLLVAMSCFFSTTSMANTSNLLANSSVLTLGGAKFIAAKAAEKAHSENWNVIIVVSDASGYVKYLERMDNVQLASLETAIKKAETAALYRRSTKVFHERVQGGETPLTLLPNMLAFEGGLPIIVNGQVIGAVGVSGAKGHQDAQVAQAGIDAFLMKIAQ